MGTETLGTALAGHALPVLVLVLLLVLPLAAARSDAARAAFLASEHCAIEESRRTLFLMSVALINIDVIAPAVVLSELLEELRR